MCLQIAALAEWSTGLVSRSQRWLCSQPPQSMAHRAGSKEWESCFVLTVCKRSIFLSWPSLGSLQASPAITICVNHDRVISSSNRPTLNAMDPEATVQATGFNCHLQTASITRPLSV
jgi:hypothetical protein